MWKEGVSMEAKKTLCVTLRANTGRKRITVNNGVIEQTYPSIFIVRLDDDTQRKVTYSYSDVLTKTVQILFT